MNALAQAEATDVPLKDVERELLRLLKAQKGSREGPIQRAHMSNLVVFCPTAQSAAGVETHIPEIVRAHPARVLLLIGEREGEERGVRASVRIPLGRPSSGQQSCTEQITLRASGDGLMHLPFAVRTLLIGDLPTNLWWASNQPPPLAGPLLFELADQAQQIIYDSLGWREPAIGVAATATWLEQISQRGGVAGRWLPISTGAD